MIGKVNASTIKRRIEILSDLERLYTFVRYLMPKLPHRSSGPQYTFDDDVRLKYYRPQKISEGTIEVYERLQKPDQLQDERKPYNVN